MTTSSVGSAMPNPLSRRKHANLMDAVKKSSSIKSNVATSAAVSTCAKRTTRTTQQLKKTLVPLMHAATAPVHIPCTLMEPKHVAASAADWACVKLARNLRARLSSAAILQVRIKCTLMEVLPKERVATFVRNWRRVKSQVRLTTMVLHKTIGDEAGHYQWTNERWKKVPREPDCKV